MLALGRAFRARGIGLRKAAAAAASASSTPTSGLLSDSSLPSPAVVGPVCGHQSVAAPMLVDLSFSHNLLGSQAASGLLWLLAETPGLCNLNLSENLLDPRVLVRLGPALGRLPLLTTLDLSFNILGDSGIQALSRQLAQLPQLSVLLLRSNLISDRGVAALVGELAKQQQPKLRRVACEASLAAGLGAVLTQLNTPSQSGALRHASRRQALARMFGPLLLGPGALLSARHSDNVALMVVRAQLKSAAREVALSRQAQALVRAASELAGSHATAPLLTPVRIKTLLCSTVAQLESVWHHSESMLTRFEPRARPAVPESGARSSGYPLGKQELLVWAPALLNLTLCHNPLRARCAQDLAKVAKLLVLFQVLHLHNTELTGSAMFLLLEALVLTTYSTITSAQPFVDAQLGSRTDLRGGRRSGRGRGGLGALPPPPLIFLREIRVQNNPQPCSLSLGMLGALACAIPHTVLDLSGARLTPGGFDQVASCVSQAARQLALPGVAAAVQPPPTGPAIPNPASSHHSTMDGSVRTAAMGAAASVVVPAAQSLPLGELALNESSLSPQSVPYLVPLLHRFRDLHTLRLARAQLGDSGACGVARCLLSLRHLHRLWLVGNQIGVVGACALANTIAGGGTPHLLELALSCNPLGSRGVVALSRALAQVPKLQLLWLAQISAKTTAIRALVQALVHTPGLCQLALSELPLDRAVMTTLGQSFRAVQRSQRDRITARHRPQVSDHSGGHLTPSASPTHIIRHLRDLRVHGHGHPTSTVVGRSPRPATPLSGAAAPDPFLISASRPRSARPPRLSRVAPSNRSSEAVSPSHDQPPPYGHEHPATPSRGWRGRASGAKALGQLNHLFLARCSLSADRLLGFLWALQGVTGGVREAGRSSGCAHRTGSEDAPYLSWTRLNLAQNPLGAVGGHVLALFLQRMPHIEELILEATDLGGPGLSALCGPAGLEHRMVWPVTVLALGSCRVDDLGILDLAGAIRARRLPVLEVLSLPRNEFGDLGMTGHGLGRPGLAAALERLPTLLELDLTSSVFGVVGARALAHTLSLGLPRLQKLLLSYIPLTRAGLAAIAQGLAVQPLRMLSELQIDRVITDHPPGIAPDSHSDSSSSRDSDSVGEHRESQESSTGHHSHPTHHNDIAGDGEVAVRGAGRHQRSPSPSLSLSLSRGHDTPPVPTQAAGVASPSPPPSPDRHDHHDQHSVPATAPPPGLPDAAEQDYGQDGEGGSAEALSADELGITTDDGSSETLVAALRTLFSQLRRLEILSIRENALVAGELAPVLRSLALPLRDRVSVSSSSPTLRTSPLPLQILDLTGLSLVFPVARALGDVLPLLPSLSRLWCFRCDLGDQELYSVLRWLGNPSLPPLLLRELVLANNLLSPFAMHTFGQLLEYSQSSFRVLRLSWVDLSQHGTVYLSRGLAHLVHLQELDLSFTNIDSQGLEMILEGLYYASRLASVRSEALLGTASAQPGPKLRVVRALAASSGATALSSVSTSSTTGMMTSATASLSLLGPEAQHYHPLTDLLLTGNNIVTVPLRVLGPLLCTFPNLARLGVAHNPMLDNTFVQRLLSPKMLRRPVHLEHLLLTNTSVGDPAVTALCSATPRLPNLRTLHLSRTTVTSATVRPLASALTTHCPRLTALYLARTPIDMTGLALGLSKVPNSHPHHPLSVGDSGSPTRPLLSWLHPSAATVIPASCVAITTLDLSGLNLGPQDTDLLRIVLDALPLLKDLVLNDNPLGDPGAAALGPVLAWGLALTQVSLMRCQVTDRGVRAILRVRAAHPAPFSVILAQNPVSDAIILAYEGPGVRFHLDPQEEFDLEEFIANGGPGEDEDV